MFPRKNIDGFTLFELMIVLSIVAILAAIAAPSFAGMMQKSRLVDAAETLSADISLTRHQAIMSNTSNEIVFLPGNDWSYSLSNPVRTVNNPYPDVAMTTINNLDAVSFHPARGLASQSGQIDLTLDGKTIGVKVNILGRPSLCSDTVAGYAAC